MGRFIRRVFVLLVLFAIVFVIYRYINPVGASNFVEKLKTAPQYVSNMFDGGSELIIIDETVSMTGDMNLESDIDVEKIEDEKEDLEEDNSRLEELNKEIEGILGKSENGTGVDDINQDDLDNFDNIEEEIKEAIEEKEIEIEAEVTDEEVTLKEIKEQNETEEKKGLSDLDYEQIKNVFGNLVE